MRFVRNLIPLSVILALGVGVACKKPAPAPVEPPKPVVTGPTQQELDAQRQAAEEAAKRQAAAEAEAETARKAAQAAEAAKAADTAYRTAAEAALKSINFDFDKSAIREVDKVKLQAVADFLKANPQAKLSVEGHCDERGTVEYNLALGERRAHAAQNYLVGLGVAEARLASISYGKEKPLVQGQDEQSYLANRRAEFKLQ